MLTPAISYCQLLFQGFLTSSSISVGQPQKQGKVQLQVRDYLVVYCILNGEKPIEDPSENVLLNVRRGLQAFLPSVYMKITLQKQRLWLGPTEDKDD